MSLVRRIRDITRATLSELREQEAIINRLDSQLKKLSKQLKEREQLLQLTARQQQSFQHKYDQFHQLLLKREKQAFIAMRAGEEELTRQLLQEKITLETRCEEYQRFIEQSSQTLTLIREQITGLNQEIKTVLEQRQYYQDLKGVEQLFHETISFQK